MAVQKFRNLSGILTMPWHSQMQCLQSYIQQKRILGRLDGTQISHNLRRCLGNICPFAEFLRINNPMIGGIRLSQPRIFLRMLIPVKIPAIHNTASHAHCMSIHIFGGGMGDDICAPFKRTAINRRWKCIVHNQGNSMIMGCLCKFLNIQNYQCRIGNGFCKHCFCIRQKRLGQLFQRSVRIHKSA